MSNIRIYEDETKKKEIKPFIVTAEEIKNIALYVEDPAKFMDIKNPVKFRTNSPTKTDKQ